MPFRRLYPAALLIALPLLVSPALAKGPDLPERQSTLVVYGSDPCPRASSDSEAVVCARRPESDRYRIPRRFRDRPERPAEVSWASRVESLDEASAQARPNSCSVVGSYGQSGCQQQFISQWYASRRAARAANAGIP
ncbi:MAG TPA: hypothetical protein VIT38_14775 [Allosphingosinicella sp.]|jgi:hypothetical protein